MLSKDELKQTAGFVFAREQSEGGFSFAGNMPPTLEDTFFAVAVLEIIESETGCKFPVKNETREYIRSFDYDIADYKLRYFRAWLRKKYGLKPEEAIRPRNPRNLEQLYYFLLNGGKAPASKFDGLLDKDAGKMDYLWDLAYSVLVKRKMNMSINKNVYAEKIQEIQNLDGGFGFYKGSTTFLENTYLAVKTLNEMNRLPLDLPGCISFVEGCRSNTGGYGRNYSTVPFLEATYKAIKCSVILKG